MEYSPKKMKELLEKNGFSLKTEAENVTKNTVKNEIVDNTVYR